MEPNRTAAESPPAKPPIEPRPRRKRRRRDESAKRRTAQVARRVALGSLGVALVVSPQLMGGAIGWTIPVIAGLAVVALGATLVAARVEGLDARADVVSLAIVGTLAWTAFQAVPLPAAVTGFLAPDSVEQAALTADALGEAAPSFVPLSRDPGATERAVIVGAAMVSSFFAAWLLVAMGRREQVLRVVAGSIFVMAIVALAHRAVEAETVFGLYRPRESGPSLMAPLLNNNHLSGFLAMGVPLLVALAIDVEEHGKRTGILAAAVLVGATALLAMSRGGSAAVLAGPILFGALVWWQRRSSREPRSRVAGSGLAIAILAGAGVIAVAFYVAADAVLGELGQTDTRKLDVALEGVSLALQHPWTGVGRGAFSVAFVERMGVMERYEHPENLVVQWISEWGLPVGLGLLAVVGAALVRGARGRASIARLGGLAAVVTIAAHNLVDFSLELAGVGVVAAALLAAVIAPGRSERASSSSSRRREGIASWKLAAGTGVAAAIATLVVGTSVHADDAREIQASLVEDLDDGDPRAFAETLRRGVRLHPSEPAFALLAGEEALRRGDPAAVRWLNRAMQLAPGWSSPRVAAARWLIRQRRVDQSLLEIREAEQRRPGSATALACTILRAQPELEIAQRAAPRGELRGPFLDRVVQCLDPSLELVRTIDAHLRQTEPELVGPIVRSANRALAANDTRTALSLLVPAARRNREDAQLQGTLAEAYAKAGRVDDALRALARAERLALDVAPVLARRAALLAQKGDAEGMRSTMEEVRGLASGNAGKLAASMVTLGDLELHLGNEGQAMRAYEQAHRMSAASGGLARAAHLAERLGDLRRAYRAYAALCQDEAPSAPSCAARDRLEAQLVEPGGLPAQPMDERRLPDLPPP